MPEFDAVDTHTEWGPADPRDQIASENTTIINNLDIADGEVTNDKLASGLSPTKLQAVAIQVYRSGNQTISNTTSTDIGFNTVPVNSGFTDPGTSFTTFTIPTTGWYDLDAHVEWASNNTGDRTIRIMVNSTIVRRDNRTASSESGASLSATRLMTAGDLVGLQVRQSSGGNLNVTGGADTCLLSATFIGSI